MHLNLMPLSVISIFFSPPFRSSYRHLVQECHNVFDIAKLHHERNVSNFHRHNDASNVVEITILSESYPFVRLNSFAPSRLTGDETVGQ